MVSLRRGAVNQDLLAIYTVVCRSSGRGVGRHRVGKRRILDGDPLGGAVNGQAVDEILSDYVSHPSVRHCFYLEQAERRLANRRWNGWSNHAHRLQTDLPNAPVESVAHDC